MKISYGNNNVKIIDLKDRFSTKIFHLKDLCIYLSMEIIQIYFLCKKYCTIFVVQKESCKYNFLYVNINNLLSIKIFFY